MSDVGLAMQRAEEKTQTLQARAGAIDELLASGALDDPTGMARTTSPPSSIGCRPPRTSSWSCSG